MNIRIQRQLAENEVEQEAQQSKSESSGWGWGWFSSNKSKESAKSETQNLGMLYFAKISSLKIFSLKNSTALVIIYSCCTKKDLVTS